MSVWDDIADFAANVVTGGLSGAVSAATDTSPGNAGGQGPGTPTDLTTISPGIANLFQQQQREKAAAAAASPVCCGRFQWHDGFLVDGVTGHVWRFDQASSSLHEVPVTHTPARRDLISMLVTVKTQNIAAKYAAEVLRTLPEDDRAKQQGVFEKNYLEPLRSAALNLT